MENKITLEDVAQRMAALEQAVASLSRENRKGKRVDIPEPAEPIWLTDGNERFAVPRNYAGAIREAVPELRLSFEHLGGRYVGRVTEESEEEKAKRGGKPIDLSSIGGICVGRSLPLTNSDQSTADQE